MLRLDGLSCGYGDIRAVHRLDLEIAPGAVTALLGPNGAGKTSIIMCIAGHVAVQEGRVLLDGRDITNISPMQRVREGIAVVPEGRRLFPRLTVRENLVVGGYVRPKEETEAGIARVIDLFPRLGERFKQLAGSLSGGEQQMLSLGRALMSGPRLLMIDELSLGLMPKMIDMCYQAVDELKRAGQTIILVEQSTQRALEMSDHVCVLESGRGVWAGTSAEAAGNPEMIDTLLGLKKSEA